jgi:hypothetical protein
MLTRWQQKIRQIKNRYLSGCHNQIFHALLLSPSTYMDRGDPGYWYSKPEKVNKCILYCNCKMESLIIPQKLSVFGDNVVLWRLNIF